MELCKSKVFSLICMLLASAATLFGQNPIEISEKSLFPTHLDAAREFTLYPNSGLRHSLKLDETPIFVWSNPRRMGGQAGHVFLWKDAQRPLAVCTVYSFGDKGVPTDRQIVYEWHSLSESTLVPKRNGADSEWTPLSGIRFDAIPSAQAATTSMRQKLELRTIVSQFVIHSLDPNGQEWPLRVLTKPLCTYETHEGIGALIGWVGDAGNDPEFMMLLEVRTLSGMKTWCYAPIRMTDHELFVKKDGNTIWESRRSASDTSTHDSQNLYFRFRDKIVQLKSSK